VRYEHPPIASQLIGVTQEADLVSLGFEQSTAISNRSTLDYTTLCIAILPGDASWKQLCSSSVPPDDDRTPASKKYSRFCARLVTKAESQSKCLQVVNNNCSMILAITNKLYVTQPLHAAFAFGCVAVWSDSVIKTAEGTFIRLGTGAEAATFIYFCF